MTHVVTTACIGCKDTACASACPCDAFHEGPEMLYINPENCIDCELCVAECPVEAIYLDDDLPEQRREDLILNERLSKTYPVFGD